MTAWQTYMYMGDNIKIPRGNHFTFIMNIHACGRSLQKKERELDSLSLEKSLSSDFCCSTPLSYKN